MKMSLDSPPPVSKSAPTYPMVYPVTSNTSTDYQKGSHSDDHDDLDSKGTYQSAHLPPTTLPYVAPAEGMPGYSAPPLPPAGERYDHANASTDDSFGLSSSSISTRLFATDESTTKKDFVLGLGDKSRKNKPKKKRKILRDTILVEPHPPEFKTHKFHEERSCTDVLCYIVFMAFLTVWVILASFAFLYGHPAALINPSDSKGRICGSMSAGKYDMTKRPYLYFFDLSRCIRYSTAYKGCATTQVCVSECPDFYSSYIEVNPGSVMGTAIGTNQVSLSGLRDRVFCSDDGWMELNQVAQHGKVKWTEVEKQVNDQQCTAYVVASKPIAGRCIPELIIQMGNQALKTAEAAKLDKLTNDAIKTVPNAEVLSEAKNFVRLLLDAKAVGEKILTDLRVSWWQILIFLAFAAIVSFGWIALMRWFGRFMIWISIFSLVAIVAAGTIYSWVKFFHLRSSETRVDWKVTTQFSSYLDMKETWLVLGFVGIAVLILFLFLLCFLRTRIQIAICMIEESSKAVTYMPSSLFFPAVPSAMQFILFIFWLSVALHIQSWGIPQCHKYNIESNLTLERNTEGLTNVTKCDCDYVGKDNCTFLEYTKDSYVQYLQIYNLFAVFWVMFFLAALEDLSLAGGFASYYWAFRKPEDVPTFPVWRGMYRALRYHAGSLAFGSFILAVTKMIRVVLEYIHNKVKDSKNPVAKGIVTCCRCCFWLLEKFMNLLTRNAWIMMAIYGNSFMKSATDSCSLLLRNFLRVWVLDKTTDFLFLIGKMCITTGMGALAYFYFKGEFFKNEALVGQLNYYTFPIIVVTIASYLICDSFFDVYEMAVDTTFICFLEDSERNDGSIEKPYYMSKKLMKLLNKQNKQSEEEKKT